MRTFVSAAITAGLALSLVACDGSKGDTAAAPSITQSSTPSPTPVPTTSATPSVVPTTPAAPAPRSKASVTMAVLALVVLQVVVTRGFSGGQDGPFVQETLEAMPSAKATTAHLATIKAAVKSCTKAKLTISGAGTSTVAITEVAAPKAGAAPVAVRFAADGGPLDGLEVTFAFAGLDDVLLSMNFDFADIELPALAASKKANTVLGTTTGGA